LRTGMSEELNEQESKVSAGESFSGEGPSGDSEALDREHTESVPAELEKKPAPSDDRVSRFASISLMVAILAIAGIFSAMTAMRIAIRGREVAVPDLQNKTEAEARQLLESKGLKLRVAQSQFTKG